MPKCGRRTEIPPFEGGIAGIMREDFINRNAPFGTQFTPTFRTKIIGGKLQHVKETQKSFPFPSDDGNQKHPSQKTTQDDAVQTDFDGPLTQLNGANKKKKSEDWAGQHSILPPIPSNGVPVHLDQTNHTDHTKAALPPIAQSNDKGYKQTPKAQQRREPPEKISQESNANEITSKSSLSHNFGASFYEPNTYDDHGIPREPQWKPAAGYSYLAPQPITLTKDQEIFLLRKLSVDIAECTYDQVKNVYKEMAANDHNLSGWGSYADLGTALRKHGVYPNMNALRLLASTCVSATDVGYVDYEKILSFLIAAIKKSKEAPLEHLNFYSQHNGTVTDSFSPVPEHGLEGMGRLLRLVQQQLLLSNATLNVEKLRTMFSKADRSFRLTLSQAQIKEVCHKMDVPISDSVLDQILAHCHSHGDGQYVWTDFIDILEKIQPHATGLPIPESKRPLEYAKKYLQPNENWPHPDPSHPHRQPADENPLPPHSPVKVSGKDQGLLKDMSLTAPAVRSLQHQHISAPAGLPTRSHGSEQQISPRGLGIEQRQSHPWSKSDPDTWFEGFRKLAEALFRNDLNKKGSMTPEKCRWLITEYNEIYDLRLNDEDVNRCVYRNTTTSGTDIDGLLQHLLSLKQS